MTQPLTYSPEAELDGIFSLIKKGDVGAARQKFHALNFFDEIWLDKNYPLDQSLHELLGNTALQQGGAGAASMHLQLSKAALRLLDANFVVDRSKLVSLLQLTLLLCSYSVFTDKADVFGLLQKLMQIRMHKLSPVLPAQQGKAPSDDRLIYTLFCSIFAQLFKLVNGFDRARGSNSQFSIIAFQEHTQLLGQLHSIWKQFSYYSLRSPASSPYKNRTNSDQYFVNYLPYIFQNVIGSHSCLLPVWNMASLCALRLTITQLLHDVIYHFPIISEFVSDLYTILNVQIRLGSSALKKASLATLNLLLEHQYVADIFPMHIINTTCLVLDIGSKRNYWPSFRDAEFDNMFAKTLCWLKDWALVDGNNLVDTLCSSFAWNMSHSYSALLKKSLVELLYHLIKSSETNAPLVSLVLPFLDDSDIFEQASTMLRSIFSQCLPTTGEYKRSRRFDQSREESQEDSQQGEAGSDAMAYASKKRKLDSTTVAPVIRDDSSSSYRAEIEAVFEKNIAGHSSSLHTAIGSIASFVLSELLNKNFNADNYLRLIRMIRTILSALSILKDCAKLSQKLKDKLISVCALPLTTLDLVQATDLDNELWSVLTDALLIACRMNVFKTPVPGYLFEIANKLQNKLAGSTAREQQELRKYALRLLCALPAGIDHMTRVELIRTLLASNDSFDFSVATEMVPLFISSAASYTRDELLRYFVALEIEKAIASKAYPAQYNTAAQEAVASNLFSLLDVCHRASPKKQSPVFAFREWLPFLDLLKHHCSSVARRTITKAVTFMFQLASLEYIKANVAATKQLLALVCSDPEPSVRKDVAIDLFSVLCQQGASKFRAAMGLRDEGHEEDLFKQFISLWSKDVEKPEFTEPFILALGVLGCNSTGILLQHSLFRLFEEFGNYQGWICESALSHSLDMISSAHAGKPIAEITLSLFDREFHSWLLDKVAAADGKQTIWNCIYQIADIVFDSDVTKFLVDRSIVLIPLLVSDEKNAHKSSKLQKLARLSLDTIKNFLVDIIIGIFLYSASHKEAEDYISRLFSWFGSGDKKEIFTQLVSQKLHVLIVILVEKLGSTNAQLVEQAKRALQYIPYFPQEACKRYANKTANIVRLTWQSIASRVRAMRDEDADAVPRVLNNIMLLDKDVASLCRTDLITLTTEFMMECPGLIPYFCSTLRTFFQEIKFDGGGAESKEIAYIIAVVLDYVELFPKEVSDLIEWVIVDNQAKFSPAFPYIPSMPKLIKQLDQVRSIIQGVQGGTIEEKILRLLDTIQQGNYSWKKASLRDLRDLLRTDEARNDLNLRYDKYDFQLASIIMYRLLYFMHSLGQDLYDLCAQCLGAVGAIEPSFLLARESQDAFAFMYMDLHTLALHVIKHYLIKNVIGYSSSASITIERKSRYCIQELLRTCIRETLADRNSYTIIDGNSTNFEQALTKECPWFNATSEQVVEFDARERDIILQIARNANYKASATNPSEKVYEEPDWLVSLCRSVVKKLKDGEKHLFGPLYYVFKRDRALTAFIAPYLLHYAISTNDETANKHIVKQIYVALDATKVQTEVNKAQQYSEGNKMNSPYSAKSPHTTDSEASESTSGKAKSESFLMSATEYSLINSMNQHYQSDLSEAAHRCQQVFTLLDILTKWHTDVPVEEQEDYKKDTRKGKQIAKPLTPAQLRMEAFLKSIKNLPLSFAAFMSKSYYRALMYYEAHLRAVTTFDPKSSYPKRELQPSQLRYLYKLYSALSEPDGLLGIAAYRTNTSLEEQIIDQEAQGQWSDVMLSYEQAIINDQLFGQGSDEASWRILLNRLNLLHCFRNMGTLSIMADNISGLERIYAEYPAVFPSIATYGAQAAWRLGNWDQIKHYAETYKASKLFEIEFAVAIAAYVERDQNQFFSSIASARESILYNLSAASRETYEYCYTEVLKLYLLEDLQRSWGMWETDQVAKKIAKDLKQSLSITRPTIEAREPLLSLRKTIFSVQPRDLRSATHELVNVIVQWSKLARKSSQLQAATSIINMIHPTIGQAKDACVALSYEQAKLYWRKGNSKQALAIVDALKLAPKPIVVYTQNPEERQTDDSIEEIKRKMKLYRLLWSLESEVDSEKPKTKDDIRIEFRSIGNLPKALFYMALFEDELATEMRAEMLRTNPQPVQSVSSPPSGSTASGSTTRRGRGKAAPAATTTDDENAAQMQLIETIGGGRLSDRDLVEYSRAVLVVLRAYVLSLKEHSKHISYGLPRLVTLWFSSFVELTLASRNCSDANTKKNLDKVLADLDSCIFNRDSEVPSSVWYAALVYLESRMGYGNKTLVKILQYVFRAYPYYSIWRLATALNSSGNPHADKRSEDAKEIINISKAQASEVVRDVINEYSTVFDGLIPLTGNNMCKPTPKAQPKQWRPNHPAVYYIWQYVPEHTKLFGKSNGLKSFIAPMQACMNVAASDSGDTELVKLREFEPEVQVMQSLARPRRVKFKDYHGVVRSLLLKPLDELRKDLRFMEFAYTIDRLLKTDSESRKRNLTIRTYCVIPIIEDARKQLKQYIPAEGKDNKPVPCGVVEWVDSTNTLRYYMLEDPEGYVKELNGRWGTKYGGKVTKENASTIWQTEIAITQQPVLHRFFTSFPGPAYWFRARLNFSRTLAVVSMASFIVGLGDRHTENFLVDLKTGEIVQIDVAMLFEAGRALSVAERVPFRLSRGIIDAMGVTGYEGVYKTTCEIAMKLLRDSKRTLMNVLEGFLFDPHVDWRTVSQNKYNSDAKDVRYADITGAYHLKIIERKLEGCVAKASSIDFKSGRGLVTAYEDAAQIQGSKGTSVQDQVKKLIDEATDYNNLYFMYPFWLPWSQLAKFSFAGSASRTQQYYQKRITVTNLPRYKATTIQRYHASLQVLYATAYEIISCASNYFKLLPTS